MTEQPAEEWSEMSQQTQDEIRARLMDACETRAAVQPSRSSRDLWAKLVKSAD